MDIKNRLTTDLYFVTDPVVDWVDIFTRPCYRHIIINSLDYCQKQKGLIIYTWVLMSNHIHMIVGTEGTFLVSDVLRDYKKFTSKQIISEIINNPQKSRRDWLLNRFEYSGKHDQKIKLYRFWREGNDAQEIFLESYLKQKLNYIHMNPVRAEIVDKAEDYRYSSAIDYAGGQGLLKVRLL